MSTHILSQRHFASVARSLGFYASEGRGLNRSTQLSGDLCRALEVAPFGEDDDEPKWAAAALVSDLARINVAAGNRRNNSTVQVAFGDEEEGLILNLPGLLKAAGCIRYNMDSGDSRGAAEKLDLILQILTANIIHELPSYKTAEWFL